MRYLFASIVLVVAAGYLLWILALAKTKKIATVTNFMFVTPLLSTIFGLIIINEVPSLVTVFGGVIIVLGSILF